MISKGIYYLSVLIILIGCNQNKTRIQKDFYENGQVKYINEIRNGVKHGICQSYYENGNIKFYGKFRNGLRVGEQKTFFEQDSGVVKYITDYVQSGSTTVRVSLEKYRENGVKTYESNLNVSGQLIFEENICCGGDSVILKIALSKPNNDFISGQLGVVNEFKELDSIYSSSTGHDGMLSFKVPCLGDVEGFIYDYRIELLSEKLGVTRSEHIPFSYSSKCLK